MLSDSKRRTRARSLGVYVPSRPLLLPFPAPLTSFIQVKQPVPPSQEPRSQSSPRKRSFKPLTSTATEVEFSLPLKRPSSTNVDTSVPPKFFTPADTPPAYAPARFSALKSNSSPLLHSAAPASPYARRMSAQMRSDSDRDSDGEDLPREGLLHSTLSASTGNLKAAGAGLRTRIFGIGSARHKDRPKTICTTPGALCAGETETEIDEPPKRLPTARITPASGPLVPPNDLQQRLTPLLFEFSRLLSIVPAIFGTLYNLYRIYQPPPRRTDGRSTPERVDFAVSALWAILTGYQCLCLTTGLLTRWRLYYPPLPTLIRLLALQGICWPATQLTCTVLEHEKRPVVVWAAIGTTTCVSRGVQMWVTSNLWWETREVREKDSTGGGGKERGREGERGEYWKRWSGGRWGGRRWDWKEVGVKCVLPAGIVYCVMAWAEQLRREFSGC